MFKRVPGTSFGRIFFVPVLEIWKKNKEWLQLSQVPLLRGAHALSTCSTSRLSHLFATSPCLSVCLSTCLSSPPPSLPPSLPACLPACLPANPPSFRKVACLSIEQNSTESYWLRHLPSFAHVINSLSNLFCFISHIQYSRVGLEFQAK